MKIVKIFLSCLLFVIQLPLSAIGTPQVISPASDNVSLRPTFVISQIKNAVSYSYKLKQFNGDGDLSMLDQGTLITPTLSFTVTDTLAVNTNYVLILRAQDGSGGQSSKGKFYFRAIDKKVMVTESQILETTSTGSPYQRFFSGKYGTIVAGASDFEGVAQVDLPDGSVITGFGVRHVDESVSGDNIFFLLRVSKSDLTNDMISEINSSGPTSLMQTGNINPSFAKVINQFYYYILLIRLASGNRFSDAEISYTD